MQHAYVLIPAGLESFEEISASDPLTFRKELIYAGSFAKKDQKFSVDADLLNHWKSTFDVMKSNGIDVPLPVEHTTDPEKNRGKILKMSVEKNKAGKDAIFAHIQFRDAEAAKLAKTSNVSIFQPPEFTDGMQRKYARPIRHVALTDYPVIPALENFEPIAASLNGDGDTLELMYPPTASPPAVGLPGAPPAPAAAPAPAPAAGGNAIKALAGALGIAIQQNQDDNAITQMIVTAFNQLKQKVAAQSAVPPVAPQPVAPQAPKIAASIVKIVQDNRGMRLDDLAKKVGDRQPVLSPACRDKLKAIFATEDSISLSLSEDANVSKLDHFEAVLAALSDNVVTPLGENSPVQIESLRLSNPANNGKAAVSPIVANAEKRAREEDERRKRN